jgi:hypothetical protein
MNLTNICYRQLQPSIPGRIVRKKVKTHQALVSTVNWVRTSYHGRKNEKNTRIAVDPFSHEKCGRGRVATWWHPPSCDPRESPGGLVKIPGFFFSSTPSFRIRWVGQRNPINHQFWMVETLQSLQIMGCWPPINWWFGFLPSVALVALVTWGPSKRRIRSAVGILLWAAASAQRCCSAWAQKGGWNAGETLGYMGTVWYPGGASHSALLGSNYRTVHPGAGIYPHSDWLKIWSIWQWVKTNSTPVVHIKIAGIYGCE